MFENYELQLKENGYLSIYFHILRTASMKESTACDIVTLTTAHVAHVDT